MVAGRFLSLQSEIELNDYDSADMKRWADASVLEYAYESGEQNGLEKGREEAREQRLQIIQRLLKRNRPLKEIIEDLDLTAEEIDSLHKIQ